MWCKRAIPCGPKLVNCTHVGPVSLGWNVVLTHRRRTLGCCAMGNLSKSWLRFRAVRSLRLLEILVEGTWRS
eukprot:171765-Hanusia_phi.AAC.1